MAPVWPRPPVAPPFNSGVSFLHQGFDTHLSRASPPSRPAYDRPPFFFTDVPEMGREAQLFDRSGFRQPSNAPTRCFSSSDLIRFTTLPCPLLISKSASIPFLSTGPKVPHSSPPPFISLQLFSTLTKTNYATRLSAFGSPLPQFFLAPTCQFHGEAARSGRGLRVSRILSLLPSCGIVLS